MTDRPPGNSPRGKLRELYERLKGAPAALARSPSADIDEPDLPSRIGHYRVLRKLGQGGMGVVYEARDERLGRTIALKTMTIAPDDVARSRFWREARVAASVNHPNICQIYEIGEDKGELFIAMELLEGEALSDRLRSGALPLSQAVTVGLGMLGALAALHDRGIVHRDLKPSNVFLTSHGVKLLDFGLARTVVDRSINLGDALTLSGAAVGTPRYMAPEQVLGQPVNVRADLFAAGAIVFEMLAGRPAFSGSNIAEIVQATLSEQPPALTGAPSVAAIDRLIRRALAKRPADRPVSAQAMADELRDVAPSDADGPPVLARALTRIVVLPFRVLRPDSETDFLAFSLSDAIATSLSGIGPLVVRSTATASKYSAEAPDLKLIAAEADVDRVVLGTLLRSGGEIRATAQLVETPSGTLLATHTVQSSLGDLFSLQDNIARGVVDALALPLGVGSSPTLDIPRDARAYERYLRANELARTYDGLPQARDLYRECVDLDSRFAPAWAHLGRCERVIGKYFDSTPADDALAQGALRRALELNPRLTIAHKFLAQLEADVGHAQEAMIRLLEEANRHGNDPELFAGLVHACRYCGLYPESIAAHAEARRLDPNVPTSLEQTLMMTGDLDRLRAVERPAVIAGADDGIRIMALGLAGFREEALELLAEMRQAPRRVPAFRAWSDTLAAWLERRPVEMLERFSELSLLKIQSDPEAIFIEGWLLCDAGAHEAGLGHLHRATAKGYFAYDALATSPPFNALRDDRDFQSVVATAQRGRDQARAAFRTAGGEKLLA